VCAVGTNRGIVQWARDAGRPTWLTPPAPLKLNTKNHSETALFRDVFAVDFQADQSAVLLFGGRPGALFTADTRVPCARWSHLQLPSTITHLKCLGGGNQVLVAGLRNQLGVYDLRFVRSQQRREHGDFGNQGRSNNNHRLAHPSRNSHNMPRKHSQAESKWFGLEEEENGKIRRSKDMDMDTDVAQPVVQFEHYRNSARIDIGFAYDKATGTVAAAHDDVPGTVALYSVRTGSRLRTLDLAPGSEAGEAGRATYGNGNASIQTQTQTRSRHGQQNLLGAEQRASVPIIKSLQFQTFPRDLTPTLFVGAGRRGGITAFSFDVDELGDEA
jgi:hypothetical protein